MSAAVFRLESFAAAAPEPVFTRADLDAARAEGRAAAEAEALRASHRAVTDALQALAAELAADETRRAAMRLEAVAALAPVVQAAVTLMAPPATSGRIEAALMEELRRIAAGTAPLAARIRCDATMRPMLERCLAATGLGAIDIAPAQTGGLTIDLQGGRIEFDPERVAAGLQAILDDIQKDDTTWTR